jgi:3-keto-disaccharide hydrolase
MKWNARSKKEPNMKLDTRRSQTRRLTSVSKVRTVATVFLATSLMLAFVVPVGAEKENESGDVIHLFNGKDLSSLYTYLDELGRDKDPEGVFTVQDGLLRISGERYGCITTDEEFSNYRLVAEFKWGDETWAHRKNATRDSGVLVHSTGEDGAFGEVWMYSIEVQVIEGGTGDFIVVGDKSDRFSVTVEAAEEQQQGCYVFQEGGKPATVNIGRVNWWGRDPGWEDVIGFRGAKDVEKPVGEWNRLEVLAKGSTIEVTLNGVLVNRAIQVRPDKGKIQVQSEGAEIFLRKMDLYPLNGK